MTSWIVSVFLLFFFAHYAVETALAVLNLRHAAAAGPSVPDALAGRISEETAARSLDYTLVKGRFALVQGAWGAVLTLGVLFSGLLPWLDGELAAAGLFSLRHEALWQFEIQFLSHAAWAEFGNKPTCGGIESDPELLDAALSRPDGRIILTEENLALVYTRQP